MFGYVVPMLFPLLLIIGYLLYKFLMIFRTSKNYPVASEIAFRKGNNEKC